LSVFGVYRKIFELLDKKERRRFFLLVGILMAVAVAELAGLSAVFAVLAVLSNPERITSGGRINWLYDTLGFTSVHDFQIAVAAGAIVVLLGSQAVKAVGIYATARYTSMRNYSLSSRLLSLYLRQPYAWYLNRNSADASRKLLNEIQQFNGKALVPALNLIASTLPALAIIGFLLYVDPLICLVTSVVIGGGYLVVFLWQRRRLSMIGKELVRHNKARFRLTSEAMGGFKEVKLLGLERDFSRRFDKAGLEAARHNATASVLQQVPKLALEAIVFGFLILLVMVLLLRNDGNLSAILPTLGIFAFATMRLFPRIQNIYAAFNTMQVGQAALDQVYDDYMASSKTAIDMPSGGTSILRPERQVVLDKISYSYPKHNRTALKDVSLEIRTCTTVGIVGGTGAGKTTLVDVILGLLTPDSGEIRIDDTPLGLANMRPWQRAIGYVPQSIYLIDDTVARNIAFGLPAEEIDQAAIERAAKLAALHDFVTTELPDGYNTIVGERGVRLSGGQRQRIGIARALYNEPSLLILDEATSALDNITERVVMEAVDTMRHEMTIVMIAHRLSTVRQCDVIHIMERGTIVASGTYDELLDGNELFRKMAVGT
jgi:ABC-type multidrug transport system fused ATPase/permease subunit